MKGYGTMIRIVNIFTGMGPLVDHIGNVFRNTIGECEITNIADDGILGIIIKQEKVTDEVARRVECLLEAAQIAKPDLIVCTCSSVGEVAEAVAKQSSIPILRIDEPMAKKALETSDKIAVMATLKSTMEPTCSLLERVAVEMGKKITVERVLMPEVMTAMRSGKMDEAIEIVRTKSLILQEQYGVIMMAQASLGMMKESIQPQLTIPILASPEIFAEYVQKNYIK